MHKCLRPYTETVRTKEDISGGASWESEWWGFRWVASSFSSLDTFRK
jgi:hypothetical protein